MGTTHVVYKSIGEISQLLASIQIPDDFYTETPVFIESWIQGKYQQHSGSELLASLERNAIYLAEGTKGLKSAVTQYLTGGEPILEPEQIADYINYVRVNSGRQNVDEFLAYMRSDVSEQQLREGAWMFGLDSSFFARLADYRQWRQLRATDDLMKWMDEMEFSCKFFQAQYLTAQHYLSVLLFHHQFAGCAQLLGPSLVYQEVDKYVTFTANLAIGNVKFTDKDGREIGNRKEGH